MNSVTGTRPSPSTVGDDGWSEEATFTLIDAWGKLYKKLNRKNLRQYHWKEIAKAVNDHQGYSRKSLRTYAHCKDRIDALKKKYAMAKIRVSENGFYDNDDDAFPFFDKLDSLIAGTLPAKKVTPPFEPPVKVSAWSLAPVGHRSGAQSTQKRPATVTTEEESPEHNSRFRRNLSAFAAAESEIDNSDSDDLYYDNSDGSELSNENRKRKRGSKDVEFGYREVAGRNDREFGSRDIANVMEKFSEVHERIESSKQRRNAMEKFSEVHERVGSSKQRRNIDLEKQNMQFQKDCQSMLQLQKTNHSKETERTTSMNDRNDQNSKVKNLPTAPQKMNSVIRNRPSPSTVLEDGWSEEATFTLIDAWGKLYNKVNRKYFPQCHWKEIAKAVNDHHGYSRKSRRTYVHCKNRIDTLKKKYAIEKARVSENGFYDNDDDAFPFFDKLDSLIGDTLPVKKVTPSFEPPVNAPTWALAPVGRRSGAQSAQKRPAMAITEEGSVEEDSRFRRNLSVFAAAAAAAVEAEIDNSDSHNSDSDWYCDNSDGSELSNENQKRKRGRKDVEFGYREVAGRNDREFGSREVSNVMGKFSEVHERVESLKHRRNTKEKFSEIHERVESSTQRRNVDLEKRNMQFEKDCQRLLQLQKTNHPITTSMNDGNEQNSKVKNLPAPTQNTSDTPPTKRNVRGATRMKKLALDLVDGQKLSIEFDESIGKPLGENKTKFKSHVALLGRSKVSILTDDWDSVDQSVKDEIWTDILKVWDVPQSGFLRKRWVAYAGERWRAFKTDLTCRYIYGDLRDRSPLEIYNFLDEETWQAFVQIRLDPSFQEKRKRAQMMIAHNTTPHRLSRGGYELLQEKMMQEKLKEKKESLGGSVAAPPSPPGRHEQWKRARQKPSGDYTSEDSRIISEKIDSLVEKTSQGTFVPQGRKDILTEAIGRPEHGGCVRGVGRGLGIRQYFGSQPRSSTPPVFSREQIQTIKAELTQQIKEELMQDLEAMGFSKKNPNFPTCSRNTTVPASTKGSSSVVPPIAEEDETLEKCELYVDNLLHPVAYGNVYKLGPTIHNHMLENDMLRVVVSEVLDAHIEVPIPTDEVETVEQALNHFIQWPKRLVQIVSDKDFDGSEKHNVSPKNYEPQRDSVKQLVVKAICMAESIKLDLEHDRMKSLWLSQRDIMELCMGKQELSITIIRLWLTYLHRLSINVGKNDLYGFIDPCFIQSQHDPTNAEAYIQNKLSEDKKECYLAPYHNNHHWKLLIICPRKNNVVFLCSLDRKPDKNIIHIVDSALDGYLKLQGVQKKKPSWIYPICQRQPESYESGYYIMIHMLKIVSAGIIDSWTKIFGNPEPFQEDELGNVRQRCATLILDFILGV